MIDTGTLIDIGQRFRFRWDPAILAELAERPSRYRALASRLQAHVGQHLDDNALSRSLRRLVRYGLVTADSNRIGKRDFKVYRLTDKGREHVGTYQALVAAFTQRSEHHPLSAAAPSIHHGHHEQSRRIGGNR